MWFFRELEPLAPQNVTTNGLLRFPSFKERSFMTERFAIVGKQEKSDFGIFRIGG